MMNMKKTSRQDREERKEERFLACFAPLAILA